MFHKYSGTRLLEQPPNGFGFTYSDVVPQVGGEIERYSKTRAGLGMGRRSFFLNSLFRKRGGSVGCPQILLFY